MPTIMQWLRKMQPAYEFHLAGLFLIAIFMATLISFPAFKGMHLVLLFIASLAFAIGFSIWSWPTVKKVWDHPAIKVLTVIIHLFVLLTSAILARNVVASAIGLPPQDFEVSVGLIALVYYVPTWAMFVSILVGIFAFFLYLIGLFIGTVNRPFKETVKLLGHAAGALAICFYSFYVFDFAYKNEKSLYPFVRWVALLGDFQRVVAYPGFGATERIRLHENGVISVATVENNTVVIRVRVYEQ